MHNTHKASRSSALGKALHAGSTGDADAGEIAAARSRLCGMHMQKHSLLEMITEYVTGPCRSERRTESAQKDKVANRYLAKEPQHARYEEGETAYREDHS